MINCTVCARIIVVIFFRVMSMYVIVNEVTRLKEARLPLVLDFHRIKDVCGILFVQRSRGKNMFL